MNPIAVDIRDLLVAQGIATDDYEDSSSASEWFISIFTVPDRNKSIAISDSPALQAWTSLNSKHLGTDDKIFRPSFQILLKDLDYKKGFTKIESIRNYLHTIHRNTINNTLYLEIIDRGDIIQLGKDQSNRFIWALNRTGLRMSKSGGSEFPEFVDSANFEWYVNDDGKQSLRFLNDSGEILADFQP